MPVRAAVRTRIKLSNSRSRHRLTESAAIVVPSFKKSIDTARQRACALNRRNIDGIKLQWATDNKQPITATPGEDELFGKGRYIEHKPGCPAGGLYAINAVDEKCTCNLPRHEDGP